MIFSSITFLYCFIPIVIMAYFIVPKYIRNVVLLISSLVFYAWGEPINIIFMIVSILQGYIFGILIERNRGKWQSRLFVTLTVIFSFGLLVYFKYMGFIFGGIIKFTGVEIPIGISFYTFQLASYVIDIYYGRVEASKNLINFATYVSMFPQLIAGPIVRYTDIENEINSRKTSYEDISYGIRRFVIGLSKKILLANTLGELVAKYKQIQEETVLFIWLYAVACTLQIYYDFSGYSDMAVGLGRILGFRFPENFNYPYISKSITDFWRRWHITLGGWFRDYLYIPLGGNRVSHIKWIRNVIIVWMATGLWHGAAWNFVLWGIMFAFLLVIEKLWLIKYLEKIGLLRHLYVMIFVIISFLIFDTPSIGLSLERISHMFGFWGAGLYSGISLYYLNSYAVLFLIAIIGCTPLPAYLWSRLYCLPHSQYTIKAVELLLYVVGIIVCTSFLVDGSFNPFLYFRF